VEVETSTVVGWGIGDAKTVTAEEMRRAKVVSCIISQNNKRTIGRLWVQRYQVKSTGTAIVTSATRHGRTNEQRVLSQGRIKDYNCYDRRLTEEEKERGFPQQ
jgi:hypothetical protein